MFPRYADLSNPHVKREGDDLLEIKVYSKWCKVTPYIFRSWTGPRRVNGISFTGPVYILGCDDEA